MLIFTIQALNLIVEEIPGRHSHELSHLVITMTDITYLSVSKWTAVQRDVMINYDLENSPLQIRTDSVVGSYEKVHVNFFNAQESTITGVQLLFSNPPQYYLGYCSNTMISFPTALPPETDKIWMITLVRTSDIRLMIHCNDKEVLNVVISDTTCSYSSWSYLWSKDFEKMKFLSSGDTASDYYRAGKLIDLGVFL